jgi:serpin B
MLAWLAGKRLTKHHHRSSGARRRRAAARAPQLRLESLEARCLLTVAPLAGPVPLTGAHVMDVAIDDSDLSAFPSASTSTRSASTVPALTPAQLAAEKSAGESINAFGLELYQALQAQAGESDNLFVSPFSISTALAMAFAGARGPTAAQMAEALHFSSDPAEVARQFGALLTDLNGAGQGAFALTAANALWGQDGVQYLSEFLATMQNDYAGGLSQVDFINAPEEARETINAWVVEHTNGKILDLFPKGSIDEFTRLVLANAIYFKGDWATQFRAASTYDATFTLLSGATEQASTMHGLGSYRFMQRDGFQVLELPYAGGRLVMDVLLPTAGSGLAGLDVGQLPDDLNGWLSGLGRQKVMVSLPKFKMTSEFDLAEQLQALGMTEAFMRTADFSGLSDSVKLQISQVRHKAFIEVNETGTEAAAATGTGMTSLAVYHEPVIPIEFNANHPFLFMIRDVKSGAVLFMGQMVDPPESDDDSPSPGHDPDDRILNSINDPNGPENPMKLILNPDEWQDFYPPPNFVGPVGPNRMDIRILPPPTLLPNFPSPNGPINLVPTDFDRPTSGHITESMPKVGYVGPIGLASSLLSGTPHADAPSTNRLFIVPPADSEPPDDASPVASPAMVTAPYDLDNVRSEGRVADPSYVDDVIVDFALDPATLAVRFRRRTTELPIRSVDTRRDF